ncbi:MAG: DUF819 family protein [Cyclobacteriaceae bacterium]|nr:DUF819 family protein [Cyclobacteriaceae bacterium]
MHTKEAFITNDAIILGILMGLLALVFITSEREGAFWKKFYTYVPTVLLCYFLPSLLNSFGLVDGEKSRLYFVASRFLLPASLALLTLSVDLREIKKLGFKAVIMFFAGTAGIILGGPLAILITSFIAPDVVGGVGPEAIWRGMSTIAGSWIGGGANQAAMYEVFKPSAHLYSTVIAVDVIIANIWMGFLLFGIGRSKSIDKFFKADSSSIEEVKHRVEAYRLSIAKIPTLSDLIKILTVGFGAVAIGHAIAGVIAPYFKENFPVLERISLTSEFFWIVVIATLVGLILSFTKTRTLEGVGASRVGSAFVYVLIATIGMKMNIMAIFDNPALFLVGALWMVVHVIILIIVAKLIKAPFFFLAVGSQANVGGAASAPVVASAFHPSLAPVGVLLAVLGYTIGTLGAYITGLMMQAVAP